MKFVFFAVVLALSGCLFSSSREPVDGSNNQNNTNNANNSNNVNNLNNENNLNNLNNINNVNNVECVCDDIPEENVVGFCDQNGECVYECVPGFLDCDEAFGCELPEFPESCGCFAICEFDNPANANAEPFCVDSELGICGAQCDDGFTDQDDLFENGCELECVPISDDEDPPGDGIDANCDGADGIVEEAFFIDFDGTTQGIGTIDSPANTFRVTEIEDSGTSTVFIRGDGQMPLISGLRDVEIYGGYDQNWLASEKRSVISNASNNLPALATQNAEVTFYAFEFEAVDVTANPHEFSRAVDLNEGEVTFFDCVIKAANIVYTPPELQGGGDGQKGQNGVPPNGVNGGPQIGNGGRGGDARPCPDPSALPGANGLGVANGNGGTGGQPGLNGCGGDVNASTPGSVGGTGAAGGNGSMHMNQQEYVVIRNQNQVFRYINPSNSALADGAIGAGGGGGGGGGSVDGGPGLGGGSGGAGGRPGSAGNPGVTGISTVGIVIRGATTMTSINTEIIRGQAGDGGLGGIGGCGGNGGSGGQAMMAPINDGKVGGRGGDGGPGGSATHGSSGNGGLAIGILEIDFEGTVIGPVTYSGGAGGSAGMRRPAKICNTDADDVVPGPVGFDGAVFDTYPLSSAPP